MPYKPQITPDNIFVCMCPDVTMRVSTCYMSVSTCLYVWFTCLYASERCMCPHVCHVSSCFLRASSGSSFRDKNLLYTPVKYVDGGVWVTVDRIRDGDEVSGDEDVTKTKKSVVVKKKQKSKKKKTKKKNKKQDKEDEDAVP